MYSAPVEMGSLGGDSKGRCHVEKLVGSVKLETMPRVNESCSVMRKLDFYLKMDSKAT